MKTINSPELERLLGRTKMSLWNYVKSGKLPKPQRVPTANGSVNQYNLAQVLNCCRKHKLLSAAQIAIFKIEASSVHPLVKEARISLIKDLEASKF